MSEAMRRARIDIVKPEIIAFFEAQPKRVFSLADLTTIFEEQREHWQLPKSSGIHAVIVLLTAERKLHEQRFRFKFHPVTLFLWETPSVYEIAMALRPCGYLSHYSALHHHGLTTNTKPGIIYVNDEQGAKPTPQGELEQSRITAAFQCAPRISNNRAKIDDISFCLLSGKHTDRLGVTEVDVPNVPIPVRVTNLERTLIDSVVRTAYAGGVYGVLEAYRRAAGKVNIAQLASMLDQLRYSYPYHQSIGFYLERSQAYDTAATQVFRAMPMKYDFYLDYAMDQMNFSQEWRLYYPAYLDIAR